MPDEIAITRITKESHGLDNAMEVTGVVNGQERRFRLDVPTFEREAKQGEQHLQETLKDALRGLHERE